jgi:hypothetical protein
MRAACLHKRELGEQSMGNCRAYRAIADNCPANRRLQEPRVPCSSRFHSSARPDPFSDAVRGVVLSKPQHQINFKTDRRTALLELLNDGKFAAR